MLVKIEARILIFPGMDFHFPSTSVAPGTFLRLCLIQPLLALMWLSAHTPLLQSAVYLLYNLFYNSSAISDTLYNKSTANRSDLL